MVKLPVLWIGKETVDLIDTDIRAVVRTSPASESDVEYLPAKRCKTCKNWGFDTVSDEVHKTNRKCLEGVPDCKPDGSGFCHNHEEC